MLQIGCCNRRIVFILESHQCYNNENVSQHFYLFRSYSLLPYCSKAVELALVQIAAENIEMFASA